MIYALIILGIVAVLLAALLVLKVRNATGGSFKPRAMPRPPSTVDENGFWAIIEYARGEAGGDLESMRQTLAATLHALPAEEVVRFKAHLDAQLNHAYTWELWGAAFTIMGGCSDDGFEYFGCWLVAQGKDVFHRAVADPESLADHPIGDDTPWFEDLLYVAPEVYEERGFGDIYEALDKLSPQLPSPNRSADPLGVKWEEDDLPTKYPKLWAKYGP